MNIWTKITPYAIKLGKSVAEGVLTSLVSKYAYRATGSFILSQRDKDIRKALETHLEMSKAIAANKEAIEKLSDTRSDEEKLEELKTALQY